MVHFSLPAQYLSVKLLPNFNSFLIIHIICHKLASLPGASETAIDNSNYTSNSDSSTYVSWHY